MHRAPATQEPLLARATQLLLLMGEDRRDTWLTLAFHDDHRPLYDAIRQDGATTDFTVRCVRHLLDRGCLGTRHALSLLLEVVRSDAGDELQDSFQSLIDELDRPCVAGQTAGTAESRKGVPPAPCAAHPAGAVITGTASSTAVAPPFPAAQTRQQPDAAAAAKRDFFVSYNQADRDWAEWIAWQLEEAGYTTVIQAWDFHAGHNFVGEMDRAARESRRTIAVL